MAELVVSPIVESVIKTVGSAIWKELGLLRGTKNDLEKLGSTLATIKDVLEDAERRSIADKPLRNWLKKLKDVAYDADDVLDEFRTEALRRRVEGYADSFKGKVRDFFSSRNNPIVFRRRIAHEIKCVLERVDGIARERGQFMLTAAEPISQRYDDERVTSSALVESQILGRYVDVEKVVSFLINEEEEEKDKDLSVLPIVGMGGIGKTTLARWVYHDERVKRVFELRMWVCISENFDIKEIMKSIMECINIESPCDRSNLEAMQLLLQRSLNGRRFLLILDDVWNEDEGKWERLRSLLKGGKQGSKIVVTTRSRITSRIMGTMLPHELSGLNKDLCWILFKERAFGLGREQETPNLVEIGMKIVEKCGGLPLAAKALGSLMASRRGEAEWLAIENSEIWKLPREENSVLPSLRLSYHHLPSDLKQCFAYCSSFPKDYKFDKARLIWHWISEGFIPPVDGGMDQEDTGNNYFNSLMWRSFFQDVEEEYEYHQGIVTCKMHDLMHDLACDVAGGEFSRAIVGQEIEPPENCRYLSLTTSEFALPNILGKTKKLRSLRLISSDPDRISDQLDMLLRLKHLRMLALNRISVLPTAINRLKHLRFLDLTGASIRRLPDTIGNLYNLFTLILKQCEGLQELPDTINRLQNLHTLDLSYCYALRELPGGMSGMHNLRHLDVFKCNLMTKMTPGIGQLTKLKTLTMFIVGEEDGHRITELQNLNGISGRLEIKDLHMVEDPTEAERANLAANIHVKLLRLIWDSEIEGENSVHVFESLRCPPNLQELGISGYNGTGFPNWIMSRDTQASLFKSVTHVYLSDVPRCERLPPLGQLPSLRCLRIEGMPGVRRISEEFYYGQTTEIVAGSSRGTFPFAQLVMLRLVSLVNLEEWVVEAGDLKRDQMFPNLVSLHIDGCPNLKALPDLPIIEADRRGSKGSVGCNKPI